MKIRVISEFYDKFHTSTLFKVGTVCDFDDERAQDIISKHLGEKVEDTPKVEEPKAEAPTEVAEPVKEVADTEGQAVDEVTESAEEAVAEKPAEEPAKKEASEVAEPRKPGRPKKEKAE